MNENQKRTTDRYRAGWNRIFGSPRCPECGAAMKRIAPPETFFCINCYGPGPKGRKHHPTRRADGITHIEDRNRANGYAPYSCWE